MSKNTDMEIYHLWWDRVEVDFTKDDWLEPIKASVGTQNPGIYQLYGDHLVYGDDVLLYIGMTTRTLKKRISERQNDWAWNNIKRYSRVHIGSLREVNKKTPIKLLEKAIGEIEKVLISSHNPALNKQEVNKMPTAGKHFIVLNWNDYGNLSAEVSSLRFSDYYWDTDKFPFDPPNQIN